MSNKITLSEEVVINVIRYDGLVKFYEDLYKLTYKDNDIAQYKEIILNTMQKYMRNPDFTTIY